MQLEPSDLDRYKGAYFFVKAPSPAPKLFLALILFVKICPLPNPKPVPANRPNMEAKRPPKPLIITSLCKLNTKSCLNQISITWTPSEPTYTVSIYLGWYYFD